MALAGMGTPELWQAPGRRSDLGEGQDHMADARNSTRHGSGSHRIPRELARRTRAGFSLLEVTAAIAVLTISLCGITGSIVASDRLTQVNQESALAESAVRQAVESLRGAPFATVFAQFNGTNADDPGGVVSPGADFDVPGLSATPDDADGLPGRIEFPVAAGGAADELREDGNDPALGLPADLDGDGVIDATDHSADYRILPVRVQVAWTGSTGRRTLTVETVLCAR